MGILQITKAVFLDRDGVINRNVFYPDTASYESPRDAAAFELFPDTLSALQSLQAAKYALFLVSNQPNVAKGKSTFAELQEIHSKLSIALDHAEIHFLDFYYCYHHPDSSLPVYGGVCDCRKPSPYFLQKAAVDHFVDLRSSWMIGDRITDIECGKRAGVRTIFIADGHGDPPVFNSPSKPDYIAQDLGSASRQILAAGGR